MAQLVAEMTLEERLDYIDQRIENVHSHITELRTWLFEMFEIVNERRTELTTRVEKLEGSDG